MRTLSRTPAPPGSPIEAVPFAFDDPEALVGSLRGVDTFYNTYWIRFPRGKVTFELAVENTRRLLRAAEQAGVGRFVHVSVSNPSEHSPLPYFRGKAVLEQAVRASTITHAIVRPTLIFGPNDLLVNNIAWILRRFPFFLVPGSGAYEVQPVSVTDTARIAVDAGDDVTADAAGPERYRYDELVRLIAAVLGLRRPVWHAPARVCLALTKPINWAKRDVVITREEIEGLEAGLLASHETPLGFDSFRDWLEATADALGRRYVSERARNYPRAPV